MYRLICVYKYIQTYSHLHTTTWKQGQKNLIHMHPSKRTPYTHTHKYTHTLPETNICNKNMKPLSYKQAKTLANKHQTTRSHKRNSYRLPKHTILHINTQIYTNSVTHLHKHTKKNTVTHTNTNIATQSYRFTHTNIGTKNTCK